MRYDANEQYERILRLHKKLMEQSLKKGDHLEMGGQEDRELEDLARSYFIECQNLKDYLKKDPRITTYSVEDHVSNSPNLQLAIDLGNSFKHAGLDPNKFRPRSGKLLAKINFGYHMTLPNNGAGTSVGRTLHVTMGADRHPALEIATEAINEWGDFMRANGLL